MNFPIHIPMTTAGGVALLLRLAFGVSAVLLVAGMTALALHRASAAVRHRVWLLSVLAALFMPVVLLIAPPRRMGIIPFAGESAPKNPAATAGSGAAAQINLDRLPSAIEDSREFSPAGPSTVGKPSGSHAASQIPRSLSVDAPSRFSGNIPFWIFAAWVFIAGWLFIRRISAMFAISRAVRAARPLEADQALMSRMRRLTRDLAIRRMPRLFESNTSHSPLCIGLWRAAILLPVNWRSWPAEELDAVLTHELAHIARRDVLWQTIARFTCALYWPHPLIWIAAWRMRVEREMACDDWVVRGGESAIRYTRWLVELAAELTGPATAFPQTAVAMTSRRGLEKRVKAALDPARRRRPVSRRLALTSSALAAGVIAILAIFSPLKAVDSAPPAPASRASAAGAAQTIPTTRPADVDEHDEGAMAKLVEEVRQDQTQPDHVAGHVVDENDKPVADALVKTLHPSVREIRTDAAGHYSIPLDRGVSQWLYVRAETRDGKLQGDVKAHGFGQLRLPTQDQLADLKIVMHAAREFPVAVVDEQGRPVSGAYIEARQSYQVGQDVYNATTDAEGKALLRVMPAAEMVSVVAKKDGVGLDYFLFVRKYKSAGDEQKLPAHYSGALHFVLNGWRPISVKVTDKEQVPLAGVSVYSTTITKPGKGGQLVLFGASNPPTLTDNTGIARLSVPADQSAIASFAERLQGYYPKGNNHWDPKAGADQIEMTMVRQVRIIGHVTDIDGKPIPFAVFHLMGYNGGASASGSTTAHVNKDGAFDINPPPDQFYMFAAEKDHLASGPVMQVARNGAPPIHLDFVLKPAVHVHGIFSSGNPAASMVKRQFLIEYDDGDAYEKLSPVERLPASVVGPLPIHPRIMNWCDLTDEKGTYDVWLAPGKYRFIYYNANEPFHYTTGEIPGALLVTVPAGKEEMSIDFHVDTP